MLTPARGHRRTNYAYAPHMKLHSSTTQQYQTVTGYFDGGVEINAAPYELQPDRDARNGAAPVAGRPVSRT